MPVTKCEYCSSDFGSGAGLASHSRARTANGGRCGDSRQRNLKPGSPADVTQSTFQLQKPVQNTWTTPITIAIATPASLKRKLGAVQAPLPSSEEQAEDLVRMKDKTALVEVSRADSALPPSEPALLGRGQPSEWMVSAQPDIRDIPSGEEGIWRIDPMTKKRRLSTLTGLPILDRTSRDFVVHEARCYEPWKLGPDGRLL
ncbi:hypothetical protein Slin15195_G086780 [Septoria linicola]|uniref:C2H2-type domain-containing protein n=1 Tax=Septoria linicola TaxID=215465 RepID=A0A9Q9AV19_9PEZI|nr:hypothetical protein Slin14017_G089370 [Septoria linicola]USW55359.1 hypothetical protein Slin15195_G086780 [Septoria linicola]